MRRFLATSLILFGLAFAAGLVFAAISKEANVSYNITDVEAPADIAISNTDLQLGDVERGGTANGSFDITNTSATDPISGIAIAPINAGIDVTFSFSCSGGCDTLAPSETKTVAVTLDVDPAAVLGGRLHTLGVTAP